MCPTSGYGVACGARRVSEVQGSLKPRARVRAMRSGTASGNTKRARHLSVAGLHVRRRSYLTRRDRTPESEGARPHAERAEASAETAPGSLLGIGGTTGESHDGQ